MTTDQSFSILEHTYTSRSSNFLPLHEWVMATLSPSEQAVFMVADSREFTEEKKRLYEMWMIDQQVSSHMITKNGKYVLKEFFPHDKLPDLGPGKHVFTEQVPNDVKY